MGLMAVALILTVLSSVLPEGSVKKIAGVTGGLVLLMVILQGAERLDLGKLQLSYDDYSRQINEQIKAFQEKNCRDMDLLIQERCSAYISEQAQTFGLVCSPQVETEQTEEGVRTGLCHHGYPLSRRIVSNRGGRHGDRCTAPEMVDIGRVKMMGKVRWSELWKKYKFVLLVVLVGVMLMLLPVSSGTEEPTAEARASEESFDLEAEERRMEELLGRIDGVGKLRLMLTLQSGTRLTLAEDSQKDQDRTQRETVTLNRGSSQEVVVTNRYYPVYQGAVVVCQGADSSAVRLAITETVQALTGLPSDRIQVAKWTS